MGDAEHLRKQIAMKKRYLLIAGAALVLILATAAVDPLTQIKQDIDDLKARVAYLERFAPIDTFSPITGDGSSAELAARLNRRVEVADGVSLAVTSAKMITKVSDIKKLPEWVRPTSNDDTLVEVKVTIFNTGEWGGRLNTDVCPLETHHTLATDYESDCDRIYFWNIAVDGEEFPIVAPDDDWGLSDRSSWHAWNNWGRVDNQRNSTMYFHTRGRMPLQGMLTYKHPDNEHSHRYWKLRRTRRWE